MLQYDQPDSFRHIGATLRPCQPCAKTATTQPSTRLPRRSASAGRILCAASLALWAAFAGCAIALASPTQAQPQAGTAPAAPAASSVIGTVKEINGNSLTLTLANAQTLIVQAADGVRVVQLAPGSTNLKTAEPITMKDIAIGDRVLVRGSGVSLPGSAPSPITASLLVVMKQGDIQQKQAQDLQDWQSRGTGGLVSAVDRSANTISISKVTASGPAKLLVKVTPKTIFRRYAADSVNFEDAKTATFAELEPGDQLRVRGIKSEDGTTLDAEEIVSGSFLNIAGTIASINPGANTLTVKDLATRKTVTVKLTANSSLHKLSPQMAAMFAARLHGGPGAAAGNPGGPGRPAGAASGPVAAAGGPGRPPDSRPVAAGGSSGAAPPAGRAGAGYERSGAAGGGRGDGDGAAGAGISQAIIHSPTVALADLKPGDAVMIVATPDNAAASLKAPPSPAASGTQTAPATVTAVTLVAGVEPILAATPANGQPMSLSAWTIGGDAPTQ